MIDQEERNKRKQKWMAHGFGIAKRFRESGETIGNIMASVSVNEIAEFDGYTAVLEELETTLHECGIAAFSEKFLIFMLLNARIPNPKG